MNFSVYGFDWSHLITNIDSLLCLCYSLLGCDVIFRAISLLTLTMGGGTFLQNVGTVWITLCCTGRVFRTQDVFGCCRSVSMAVSTNPA